MRPTEQVASYGSDAPDGEVGADAVRARVEAALAKVAEGLHLVDEGRRLVDEGLALLGSAPGPLTQVVTTRVMDRTPDAGNELADAPLLLDVPEAARLMGISE